jgi:beta-lactamase regulating signal transducer with metallopeptidase domain/biopolymer transport protein ExbD
MIDLLNQWGREWAGYFGLVLVQNTLFLGMILLTLKLMRNVPARLKYAVGLIGLAKLLLPPLLPAPFLAPQTISAGTASLVYLETATDAMPAALDPSTVSAASLSLLGLFLVIWIGIAMITILIPLVSTLHLKWMLRNARPIQTEHLKSVLPDGNWRILRSDKIKMPLTLGVFPRQIYVPDLWDQWTDPCRKMVLRHEAAHIQRRDGLIQIFQILTQAVYFFHPLVWILNRQVNELRELACDDESIGLQKSSSVEYSRYLVEIAEKLVQNQLGCSSASALIRQKNELLKRVMYQTQEDKMRTLSKKKTGVVIAVLLLLAVSLSWTRGRPKPPPLESVSNQEEAAWNQDKTGPNQFLPLPEGFKYELPIAFRLEQKETQKIIGTVKNKETGKPVADVFVQIPNTQLKARTDQEGNFELLHVPVGEHAIQVEMDSFKTVYLSPVILRINKDLHINVELAPTSIAVETFESEVPPPPPDGNVIEISVRNTNMLYVDGQQTNLDKLLSVLQKKTKGNDKDVFINIKAEDDVLMTTILNVQKKLSDMGLDRINYAINNEQRVPYILPPKGSEQQIKKIPEKNIVSLKINMLGEVLYQDKSIKIQDIHGRLKKDLLEQGKVLIVSLEPHPETRYKDFSDVLNQVKQSGADRLFIHLPPPPPR